VDAIVTRRINQRARANNFKGGSKMTGELILAVIVVSNIASFVAGVLVGRRNKNKVEKAVSMAKKVKDRL
jgi:hypothetical protein